MYSSLIFYITLFLICCAAFWLSGNIVVKSLMKISRSLGWKEFVVSFVIMSIAGSLPNLFVDVSSAFAHQSQLGFGDMAGGNIVDLTLSIALAALFSRKGIPAKSRTIQNTILFNGVVASLPIIMALKGSLTRFDGVILVLLYFAYIGWIFSKKEHFSKNCDEVGKSKEKSIFSLSEIIKLLIGLGIYLVAAQGIVSSANYFSISLNISILVIGLVVVGLGNCAPEMYFAITSAMKHDDEHDWMILGDLVGCVVAPATLVMGIVAIVYPVNLTGMMNNVWLTGIFLLLAIGVFTAFSRSDQHITKKEAGILLFIYIFFIIAEIFVK